MSETRQPRHRTRPATDGRAKGESMPDYQFEEEYTWFKSFGMPPEQIAKRLKMSAEALERRCLRAGYSTADPIVQSRLAELIASGRRFDSLDFPLACEPLQVMTALSAAVRRGQIVQVDTRVEPIQRNKLSVYQAAAQASQSDSDTASLRRPRTKSAAPARS